MQSASLAKNLLLAALAIMAVLLLVVLVRGIQRLRQQGTNLPTGMPRPIHLGVGFVTDFFDTLGIGSFAPTTAIFRLRRLVDDRLIPGTLNVGHALPTIAQALIFTKLVEVETTTLFVMIAAAVAGSYLGAGFVCRLPKRAIQLGMGTALAAAAALMLTSIFGLTPAGGDAIALTGGTLVFAAAMNFLLGALMTLGIGLYAPCLILVSLLGMNPTAAFPIMMSSCAFLMPIASARFVREAKFHPQAALGLLIGGVPAVLIAAFIVKSLDIAYVRWLVVIVVLYTAFGLLRSAMSSRESAEAEPVVNAA